MADDVRADQPEQFTMPMAVGLIGMLLVAVVGFLGMGYLHILAAQIALGCK